MTLWSRFAFAYRVRTHAALDRLEDPRETLDYAYDQQQELLAQVRRGLIEVATTKRQLEQQTRTLREKIPQLEDQARRALELGREDLARLALERREMAAGELADLERQVAEVAQDEQRLTTAQQTLSRRVQEFRSRRQVMSARYTAAEAQIRAKEALTGVSGELTELGKGLGRAEEKPERLRARAAAIDALIDAEALDLPLGGDDAVERELRRMQADRAVQERLDALKRDLAAQQDPPSPPNDAA
jgi:phage shock protein A